jgi:hypothetical protein
MAYPLLNKVFLVTGSTDGIGLHTAQRLASQGATVLVHGRSEARVEAAVAAVRGAAGGGGGNAAGFASDLASLAGVRQLAQRVRQHSPCIDVLVNNAGVYEPQRKASEVGQAWLSAGRWSGTIPPSSFFMAALVAGFLTGCQFPQALPQDSSCWATERCGLVRYHQHCDFGPSLPQPCTLACPPCAPAPLHPGVPPPPPPSRMGWR